MHAFRHFIEQEMDARAWTQADLSRASGLTRQAISKTLGDTREVLPERPEDKTVTGLARAFNVSREVVLTHVGLAMGLPVLEPAVVHDPAGVSDDDLLRELARRLARGREGSGQQPAPTSNPGAVAVTPTPDELRRARKAASQRQPRTPRRSSQD